MGTGIFVYTLSLAEPGTKNVNIFLGVMNSDSMHAARGRAVGEAMQMRPNWHMTGQSVMELTEEILTEAGFKEVLPPDPDRVQRIAGQLQEHGGVGSDDMEWLVEQAMQVRAERPPSEEEQKQFHDLMDRVARLQKAMARIANLRYSEPDSLSQALTIAEKALESDGTGASPPRIDRSGEDQMGYSLEYSLAQFTDDDLRAASLMAVSDRYEWDVIMKDPLVTGWKYLRYAFVARTGAEPVKVSGK